LDVDLEDFGLGLTGVLCLTDFDLMFIRECLLAGLPGVMGVAGIESEAVLVLLIEMLRRRADSTTAFGRSDDDSVLVSSSTGGTVFFSILLRVNIPRSPPFDSLRWTLGCFNGTRLSFPSSADIYTSGGLSRRANVNEDWIG
jgi:hypothetical protein